MVGSSKVEDDEENRRAIDVDEQAEGSNRRRLMVCTRRMSCMRKSSVVAQISISPSAPPSMGKIVGYIFIGFVSFLISFISYSSQIFVIWPWYGYVLSVELILLLVPFK